ncbi:MAG TPA: hypothetical protein VKV27_12760 [Solirubrobacteraceae bacterium]|nr:hypothetical protein [Solirubrobacteraceae bacterium]
MPRTRAIRLRRGPGAAALPGALARWCARAPVALAGAFARWGARAAVAVALLGALATGGWLYFRDSPLVAVRRVQIIGAGGPSGARIRRALELAAGQMTTLDVSLSALRAAVAPFSSVVRLQVSTSFPHTMRIRVLQRRAVAVISADGARVTVADDGVLLRDQAPTAALPVIQLAAEPPGERVTGAALQEVLLLADAPRALLRHVQSVWSDPVHGLVAQLRDGPRVYFGAAAQLAAKWSAVVDVLGSPSSAGASYIDVTVPQRPAAGAGSDGSASPPSTSRG